MKYTVVNTQDCRKIWAGKTGNKWFYIPRGAAGQQNINHRDVVGDIPKKKGAAVSGRLYSQNGEQAVSIGSYREKLKYSEKIKGYIPCISEEESEGYVRILGIAWAKVLVPIIAALLILVGAIVAVWYFTRESGPPLDKAAIAYQLPNGIKNEDPSRIMLPSFTTMTMDARTGQVEAVLANPEGNPCYFTYVLALADTGEELYRTDLIAPGTAIMEFTIDKELEPGIYDLEIRIETGSLDDYSQAMNSGVVTATLEVVEE